MSVVRQHASSLVAVSRDRAEEASADRVAAGERLPGTDRPAALPVPAAFGLGPGRSLPLPEQAYFERRLGTDISQVRVHPDTPAADAMGARAITAGRDIGFAPGLFRPGTGPSANCLATK